MGSLFRQTSLAIGIEASMLRTQRDRYDRACKRLLSEKVILGWILHECLQEFRETTPEEIASSLIVGEPEVSAVAVHADDAAASRVSSTGVEDTSIDEGTVWYDIRFQVAVPGSDEHIGMIVNIEAQGDFYPGYPLLKRAMYYCGRLISSQYGTVFDHGRYEKLRKVCSVWICPNPPAAFRNTVTCYSMAERNLVGHATSRRDEYDLVEVVLVCPDGDRQQRGDGILRLLGTLIGSERNAQERKAIISEEFGIPMTEQLSDEVAEMSNVSIGLEERWFQQGIEKGIERGILQGLEQGHAEGFEQGIEQGLAQGLEQGRAQGLEQGREEGLEQGRARGIEEGLEEGRVQGIEQGLVEGRAQLHQLSEHLAASGRQAELFEALSDSDRLDELLREFGITP